MQKPKSRDSETNDTSPSGLATRKLKKSGLPTVEQLARIAAILAQSSEETSASLMERAMDIWLEARSTILMADFSDTLGQQDQELQKIIEVKFGYFLPSDKYPITRDRFLQKMLPKSAGRPHLIAKNAKAYLRNRIFRETQKEPTPEEINRAYASWPPTPTHDSAIRLALDFQRWRDADISESRRDAGIKSAAKKSRRIL